MDTEMPDVLARICADTRAETARRRAVQANGAHVFSAE